MSADLDRLKALLNQVVSMELRVKNAEVESVVEMMDEYGLRYKNSWASMELADHTVIDFWRKDLFRSARRDNQAGSPDERDGRND